MHRLFCSTVWTLGSEHPASSNMGRRKTCPVSRAESSRKVQWIKQTEATETSAASLCEAPDSIITRGKVVNVLCGSCVLLLQKWNQLWLVDVSEFLWLESEALSSWMQCRGLALGKTVLQVKGIFGLRPVSQSLSFFHFKTTNFSPSHITSIFMPSSSVPIKPEFAQKVQMAKDLMTPYISIEFCIQCAFTEDKVVLIIQVKKITFSKSRFGWSLMVEF